MICWNDSIGARASPEGRQKTGTAPECANNRRFYGARRRASSAIATMASAPACQNFNTRRILRIAFAPASRMSSNPREVVHKRDAERGEHTVPFENSPALQGWVREAPRSMSPARDDRGFFRPCGTHLREAVGVPALKRWAILKERESA